MIIDYRKIQDGIEYYQQNGFELIEVPWIVSREATNITLPVGRRIARSFLGDHVGSAEQSFLELILQNKLLPGRYVGASACYRDEKKDELHQDYFMKVELIEFLGRGVDKKNHKLDEIINIAQNFFNKYISTELLDKGDEIDIISARDKIELGSYGIRSYQDFSWVYATGIAEPRLSQAVAKLPRGYHLKDIPKSKVGTVDKLYEEVLELKDSLEQGNKIMMLNELADIYGAIELLLEKNFPGINMEDILLMNNATKRAFKSGRRT